MKLKDHVTSLKLSMKLKELGVKQKSLFYWIDNYCDEKYFSIVDYINLNVTTWYASAFTSSELEELLPEILDKESEANCRAKLLIYLLENGMIKNA